MFQLQDQALSLSLGNEGTSAEVNVGWGRTEWESSNLGISKRSRCRGTFSLSANLGSVSITTQVNTGWGRQQWGRLGWGIPGTLVTGSFSLPMTLGSVTAMLKLMLVGVEKNGVKVYGIMTEMIKLI